MHLPEILTKFLSSNEPKALVESTVNTTKHDASSRQIGTGQTDKLVNKKGTANINNSTTNNYNFTFNITSNQPTEEIQALKEQFLESFHNGKIQFLRDNSEKDISGYNQFEQNSAATELIKFFDGKISPDDMLILRTGLYVQYLNTIGNIDQAINVKDHASKDHRSRNIINLASAGYFKSYIQPIFENNDPETATTEYNDIVRFMPETVFVNNNMTADDIVFEVEDKIAEKEKYHITVSKIIANGMGQQCILNIQKAEAILRENHPNFSITTETKSVGNIAYARMQINL